MNREAYKRRFCLLALGSRGDVQPFIALGRGMRAHEHDVVIAAAEDYRALAAEHSLEFAPLVGRIADRMDRVAVAAALDGGLLGSLRLAIRLRADVAPLMDTLFVDTLAAARGSDVIVVSTLGQHIGYSVAEALDDLPVVAAHFHPYTPSRHYANLFFPEWPWSEGSMASLYRRLTHFLGVNGFRHLLQPILNVSRRRVLGLPPLGPIALERFLRREQKDGLHLYAYSPRIAPPPPDWDTGHNVVTGYWHNPYPEGWQPPADLQAFLDAGAPPVYIGFGSILGGRDPDSMTRLMAEALSRTGVRGILYRGWGDIGNIPLPPDIFVTDSAPHDWLFPRCAAVVHHGGAGTTAAGLYAETPAVVVSVFGDQRFWGRHLHRLGLSPAPIPRDRLTASALADAITTALFDDNLRERTRAIGAAIKTEEGVATAISVLEQWLS